LISAEGEKLENEEKTPVIFLRAKLSSNKLSSHIIDYDLKKPNPGPHTHSTQTNQKVPAIPLFLFIKSQSLPNTFLIYGLKIC